LVIFETDVLIWFLRGDSAAARLIEAAADRAISIVSLMELIQGARSTPEVSTIRRFLKDHQFEIVPINEAISYGAAAFMEEHSQSDGLQIADALIAATTREHGDILATANVRHFRMLTGVRLKTFRPSQERRP
jgi:predicted nucleic acid-binding protein